MSAARADALLDQAGAAARAPSRWRQLLRHPGVLFGGGVLVAMMLVALLAPVLGTLDPAAIDPSRSQPHARHREHGRPPGRTGGPLGALDGHRQPRPRRLQPRDLRRPGVVDRGRRGRGAERRGRARDRPGRGLLPLAGRDRHARDGRPDGDPLDPARDRPGVALGRRPFDRADRDRDPGDSPGGPPGALDRALGPRGALRRGGDRTRHAQRP